MFFFRRKIVLEGYYYEKKFRNIKKMEENKLEGVFRQGNCFPRIRNVPMMVFESRKNFRIYKMIFNTNHFLSRGRRLLLKFRHLHFHKLEKAALLQELNLHRKHPLFH